MLSLQPRVRIYLATEPCDMRKSFRGLSGLVREKLRRDPLSGHVFAFLNRRRTMLKLLVHIQTGYAVYYLRLSRGTFQLPALEEGQTQVALDPATLTLILEGIELKGVKRRLRHRPRRPGPDES